MFRFVHAADLHLDSAFGVLAPQQAAARRRESREMPFRLANYVNTHGIDLVLDVYKRQDLSWGADNPFTTADRLLAEEQAELTVVDFHAQATSEKLAMGYYLDGRVSACLLYTSSHSPAMRRGRHRPHRGR